MITMTHTRADYGMPIAPTTGALTPLSLNSVSLSHGFWADRQTLNAEVVILHAYEWMEKEGWIRNFDLAASGPLGDQRRGREFSDSDVYKLMEAMTWEYGRSGNDKLNELFQELTSRIAPVQEPDGYLNTYFGREGQGPRYSDFEWGHELYCYGHMIQTAVARLRTFGHDEFVDIALRCADHVCSEFGIDGQHKVGGHPEIEVALAELYRATGERKYLDQSQIFIDRRGHHILEDIEFGRPYYQDEVPLRDMTVAHGHAVRAMYLAAGATDVALETGDGDFLASLEQLAQNTLARRTYITGGMGSRHTGEAFGEDFELPPDRSYSETCAGIGAIMFFQRLLLATGNVEYADHIERILYNILATSLAEDGRGFFYANTLYRRDPGTPPDKDVSSPRADSSFRAPWYHVSCCPTNIARTIASLGSLVCATDGSDLWILQWMSGTIETELHGSPVRLTVDTDYPTHGTITITVDEAPDNLALHLRIPSWAGDGGVITHGNSSSSVTPGVTTVNVSPGDQVTLDLPLVAHWNAADPRIDSINGQVAVTRGPLVYALESIDSGFDVSLARVDQNQTIEDDGGHLRVHLSELETDTQSWPYSTPHSPTTSVSKLIDLVPYYAWGNRGPATMRVWIPTL